MFPGFDLSKLPSLPLSQRNSLPACPAIYFAVDSKNRVLYVGKAINLVARWKDHHRLEQLKRINRKNPIKIAWLTCAHDLKGLQGGLECRQDKLLSPQISLIILPLIAS